MDALYIYELEARCDKRAYANKKAMQLFGATIEHADSGRPLLKGSSTQLSISHTANYLAIYASDMPCGVDIELRSRRSEHIAQKFAAPAEVEICSRVFAENPTLLVWCAKEAIYKRVDRVGVRLLEDFIVVGADHNTLRVVAFQRELILRWQLRDELLIVHTI